MNQKRNLSWMDFTLNVNANCERNGNGTGTGNWTGTTGDNGSGPIPGPGAAWTCHQIGFLGSHAVPASDLCASWRKETDRNKGARDLVFALRLTSAAD